MLTKPHDAMLYTHIIESDDAQLSITYFLFSKRRPSAIFDFHIFAIFVKNSNLCLLLRRRAKTERSAAELLCIFDFQNGGRPPPWLQSESAIIFRNCGHPYEHPDLWPPNSPDPNPVDYNNWRNESTRQKCKWKSANTYKDDKHILTANHQCGNVAPALGTSVDGIIGCGSSGSSGRIFSQTV